MNYTVSKYVSVSNLTLDLWLDYVKPAIAMHGINFVRFDDRGAAIADETIADEISHCMTVACFNANRSHANHDENVRAEAVQMLYQLLVSVKYRAATSDAMLDLHAAMVSALTA